MTPDAKKPDCKKRQKWLEKQHTPKNLLGLVQIHALTQEKQISKYPRLIKRTQSAHTCGQTDRIREYLTDSICGCYAGIQPAAAA